MHQIKLFKGIEGALSELEAEVNEFLKSVQGEVINISGNIAPQSNTSTGETRGLGTGLPPSDVIVVIHYKT